MIDILKEVEKKNPFRSGMHLTSLDACFASQQEFKTWQLANEPKLFRTIYSDTVHNFIPYNVK